MTNQQEVILVGMGDSPESISTDVKTQMKRHRIFSGGKRHYQLIKQELPDNHEWIDIKGGMSQLIEKYRAVGESMMIFTSGDPFFYGFGNTIKRLMPEVKMDVQPWFSSIHRLCHKLQFSINDLHTVTLHGRPWKGLDEALLSGKSLMGILTDKKHSPALIARRLLEYGFTEYEMFVGEHLDGESERITRWNLEDVLDHDFADLNVVLLKASSLVKRKKVFDDSFYQTLEGRPGMITKRPYRALAIQAMELFDGAYLWDVGACTGAIAIESKRLFPSLNVTAFEIREECQEILTNNVRRTSTPGIDLRIGDFFDQNWDELQAPDVVFIGGHGGRLKEMIELLDARLKVGSRIVMNTVSDDSKEIFKATMSVLGYEVKAPMEVTIDEYNPIAVLVAERVPN